MINADDVRHLRAILASLPDDVRALREERGLSFRAAAAEIGVPTPTLVRFEQAETYPRVATLLPIADWVATQGSLKRGASAAGLTVDESSTSD